MAEENLEMALDASAIDMMTLNLNNIHDNSAELQNVVKVTSELKEKNLVSIFFLLLDHLEPHTFLKLVGLRVGVNYSRINYLRAKFLQLWKYKGFGEVVMIELLGTMKLYKLLNHFGTCHHVFKKQEHLFSDVSEIWKLLYCLCEELSESKLKKLKDEIEGIERNQSLMQGNLGSLSTAEEVLCYALMKNLFSRNDVSNLLNVFERVNPECVSIIASYIAKQKDPLLPYDMKQPSETSPCGLAVIINHIEFYKENSSHGDTCPTLERRCHTERDVDLLNDTWEAFGFQTEIINDLSDVEVIKKFEALASLDHSKFDAFVCCYLSHGEKGVVYASNSKPVNIDCLIDIMANRCQTLGGKPKLFFIQACQGNYIQQGIAFPDTRNEVFMDSPKVSVTKHYPKTCDVFKVISTIPGYVSFRDRNGSWFIRALVKSLREYGDKEDITKIILRVTNEVTKQVCVVNEHTHCKQTPITETTLCGLLVFKKKTI